VSSRRVADDDEAGISRRFDIDIDDVDDVVVVVISTFDVW
jgi:hypothetical protein